MIQYCHLGVFKITNKCLSYLSKVPISECVGTGGARSGKSDVN